MASSWFISAFSHIVIPNKVGWTVTTIICYLIATSDENIAPLTRLVVTIRKAITTMYTQTTSITSWRLVFTALLVVIPDQAYRACTVVIQVSIRAWGIHMAAMTGLIVSINYTLTGGNTDICLFLDWKEYWCLFWVAQNESKQIQCLHDVQVLWWWLLIDMCLTVLFDEKEIYHYLPDFFCVAGDPLQVVDVYLHSLTLSSHTRLAGHLRPSYVFSLLQVT